MKLSALLAVSALLAEGIVAYNCKEGLDYCGRSIKLKNPHCMELHKLLSTRPGPLDMLTLNLSDG